MLLNIETRKPPVHFHDDLQDGTDGTLTIDVDGLERELRAKVRGEVRFDLGDRGMYSQDASNYRSVPIGVVLPCDKDDVVQAVLACRKFGAPIVSRGGGTGIPGQTNNYAVLFDYSKYMHDVLDIKPDKKLARVQPGCVLDTLREAANKYNLTFGPDPATHSRCTLGGMIGNNSCGIHSVYAKRTSDNVESLDIVLYDGTRMTVGKMSDHQIAEKVRAGGREGEIYAKLVAFRDKYADLIRKTFPDIPRRVSGYDLPALLPENGFNVARALVGSEGTLAVVLEAQVDLVHWPPVRSLLVLGYPDIFHAADHVMDVLPHKPLALEGLDDTFIDDMKKKGLHPKNLNMMPKGRGWLLCEFGGNSKDESDAKAREVMEAMKKAGMDPAEMKLFDNPKEENLIWWLREEGLGATARVPGEPDNWEGWEDAAVPPAKVGPYLREFAALLDKYNYEGALYGHFGDGCVHTRLDFDLETADGIAKFRDFLEHAADLVVKYGGSFSGEHGDGQARGWLLPKMFGEEMIRAFQEFKEIWDPDWRMNPGKLIDPYRVDENLRLGTHYHPWDPKTHFAFPDDKHSFAYAALRCVGAGVCRRHHGGTMCPSYMVTFEEKHSTRGRARMLFEMCQGETVTDGWKSEAVKDSLDLCLACKGCKGDCPVQVDMATYKAEFLSHYYEGRLRPITAYTMGLITWWARAAALAPGLVNLVTHTPVLRDFAKLFAGIDARREIPAFAPETFKAWWAHHTPKNPNGPPAMLWADTFNNHFHPEVAKAAVEVLEDAGFRVDVPKQHLCCGRPLYDWGMLDGAKILLREILDTLKPQIEAGVPVVVLEPSCASVFRDELVQMFPQDEDAVRLSKQTYILSEFLQHKAEGYEPPKLKRKAKVHGHCHHKSIFKMDDEEALLQRMGVTADVLDSGCCGMAGAFGFEAGEHYDIAMKCGERVLLPEVRNAPKDEIIVSNGFSCREQIAQDTDRRAVHLAQLLQMALHDGPDGPKGDYPESRYPDQDPEAIARSKRKTVIGLAALAAAGAVGLALWSRNRSTA